MITYEVWVENPVDGHEAKVKTFNELRYARKYVLNSEYNEALLHIYKVSDTPNQVLTAEDGSTLNSIDCDAETKGSWWFQDRGKVDYAVNELRESLNQMDPKYKGAYKCDVVQDKARKCTLVVSSLTFRIPYKRIPKNPFNDDEYEGGKEGKKNG